MKISSFAKFLKSDSKSGNERGKTSMKRQKRLRNNVGWNLTLKFNFEIYFIQSESKTLRPDSDKHKFFVFK